MLIEGLVCGCLRNRAHDLEHDELIAGRIAGQPSAAQPPIQQVSWTDKLLAPFGGGTPKAADPHREAREAAQASEARRQQFDPIALSNHGGPPTPALLVSLADVHARNNDGATPLMFAALFGREELADLFLEHGADKWATDIRGHTPGNLARGQGYLELGDRIER